jgi:pSer/pThr/pTyr-binding forkhead associated (FHA) protein
VGFTLKVTDGPGAGESFSFEAEARLGRTADNDLVIKDPSSSRSHARVFIRGGRHLLEDLGSANGTLLNDLPVHTARPLQAGDVIAIGDVVLEFDLELEEAGATAHDEAPVAVEQMETLHGQGPAHEPAPRAGSRRPPLRRARPPVQPEPEPEGEPEPESPGEEEEALEAVAEAHELEEAHDDGPAPDGEGEGEGEGADEAAAELEDRPTRHLAARPRVLPRRGGATSAPATVRRAGSQPEAPAMSAAERARLRRELQRSTSGRLQLAWQDLSTPLKVVVSLVLGALTLAALGALVMVALPKRAQRLVEPTELKPNGEPVRASFGLGDDVDFKRADLKAFTFSYTSPTKVVGVLHYHAKGISKGEVSVELNGMEVALVPPDLIDADSRELEVVFPATLVKVGEPNQLVFDNTLNPPAEDPWKVWNIWVEVVPIPEMSADEASRRASVDLEQASKYYELRDVGAENLFRAWKTYRDAWLLLEATPNRSESLQQIARTRIRELRPELDKRCSAMLVEYKKAMKGHNPDVVRARKILDDIPTYFPTHEHYCFNVSRALIREMDQLTEIDEKN